MAMNEISKQESSGTLADGQIFTERKLGRRSFLAAAGALLVGVAALASGVNAEAQNSMPKNKKKAKTKSKSHWHKKGSKAGKKSKKSSKKS